MRGCAARPGQNGYLCLAGGGKLLAELQWAKRNAGDAGMTRSQH
ncbi:hypothetical protein [Pantoea brenneri]|nr:hypothetical protein [Pantoea brenneri]